MRQASTSKRRNEAFISYSRTYTDFVEYLQQFLDKEGVDTWYDKDDIRHGALWWKEIKNGINSANTMIVIISPPYLKSNVCHAEAGYAFSLKKRIVPVLYLDPDRATTSQLTAKDKGPDDNEIFPEQNWKQLGAINWIYAKDNANNITIDQYIQEIKAGKRPADDLDFINSMTNIARAIKGTLRTDFDYIDQHTRLFERALIWDDKKRQPSYLLKERELKEAEKWLKVKNIHDVAPTALHIDFIGMSRKNRGKVRRRNLLLLAMTLIMLTGAGVYAVLSSRNAETRVSQIQDSADRDTAERGYQTSLVLAEQASTAYQAGNFTTALDRALDGISGNNYSAEAEWLTWQAVQAVSPRIELLTGDESYGVIQFSPDLTRFLHFKSVHKVDNQASLMQRVNNTAQTLYSFEKGSWFDGAWTPDGKHVLLVAEDKLLLTDADSGKTLINYTIDAKKILEAKLSPNGKRVAAVLDFKRLVEWDAITGEKRWEVAIPESGRVLWSPNGQRLLVANGNNVMVIDAATGKTTMTTDKVNITNWQIGWFPDGQKIWIHVQHLDVFTKIYSAVFDANTGKPVAELPFAISFWTSDPRYVIGTERISSNQEAVGQFDVQEGKKLRSLGGIQPRLIQRLDDRLILRQDTQVYIWDPLNLPDKILKGPQPQASNIPREAYHLLNDDDWKTWRNLPNSAFDLTPDQRSFYYITNRQLHMWDVQLEQETLVVSDVTYVIAVSPDSSKMILTNESGAILVLSIAEKKFLYALDANLLNATATVNPNSDPNTISNEYYYYTWSWDSKYVIKLRLKGNDREQIAVFNAETGQAVVIDTSISANVKITSILSPHGKLYVDHDQDKGWLGVLDASTAKLLHEWNTDYMPTIGSWSGDDKYIAAFDTRKGGGLYYARIYDVTTGVEQPWFKFNGKILSSKFSPASNVLLIGVGTATAGEIYWLRLDKPYAKPGKIIDVMGTVVTIDWAADGRSFSILYWADNRLQKVSYPVFTGTTKDLANWADRCCKVATQ